MRTWWIRPLVFLLIVVTQPLAQCLALSRSSRKVMLKRGEGERKEGRERCPRCSSSVGKSLSTCQPEAGDGTEHFNIWEGQPEGGVDGNRTLPS